MQAPAAPTLLPLLGEANGQVLCGAKCRKQLNTHNNEIAYMALLKVPTFKVKILWSLGVVFCTFTALVPVVSTIIIGRVFNSLTDFMASKISSHEFQADTFRNCSGLFCLAAIHCLADVFAGFICRYAGFYCGHKLRLSLLKAYCEGDMTWMDVNKGVVGVSSQAFEDIKKIEMALGVGVGAGIELSVTIISSYVVALYYSWSVTLVCMVGFPFIIGVTCLLNPSINRRLAQRKSLEDKSSARLHFIFDALTTVKVFGKELYEQMRCHKYFEQINQCEKSSWRFSFLQGALIRFLTLAMFVQGFYFGNFMVDKKGLSSGAVMTAFWSCIQGNSSLQGISYVLMLFSEGSVSAKRIHKIIKHQDDTTYLKRSIGLLPPPSANNSDILFKNVVFSYPSRPELVLRGLNLRLRADQIHYIVGSSGSGKSSLGSILLKQYETQAGKVMIGDSLIETTALEWIHSNVTLVEQNATLFDISISENLKLGANNPEYINDDIIQAALDEFHADFVYKLPQGVYTPGSFQFSGGQRQRLQLAKAWITNSAIMIFDESTSALDRDLEAQILTSIRNFRKGRTTIIITHNLKNIPEGAEVHLIEDGLAHSFASVDEMRQARPNIEHCLDLSEQRKSTLYTTPKSLPKNSLDTIFEDYCAKGDISEVPSGEGKEKGCHIDLLKSIPNKFLLLVGFTFVMIQAAMTPIFSLCFSHLLMGITPASRTTNVTFWAMMVLLVSFCDASTTYLSVFVEYVGSEWCEKTRHGLLAMLIQYGYISPEEVTYYRKLILGDVESSSKIITRYWKSWINLIVLGAVGLIWSLATGWKLSVIGLSLAPIVAITTTICNYINKLWNGRLEAKSIKVKHTLEQVITSMRSVKAQHLEKFFSKVYLKYETELFDTAMKLAFFTSLGSALLVIFTPLAQGLLLWYGMKLVSTGEYTPENVLLVFSLLIFSLATLDAVASSIQQCGNAFEAYPRIIATLGDKRRMVQDYLENGNIPVKNWGDITFSAITCTNTTLEGFTMSITPGTITAITGISGSGKTTLIRTLLKLQRPLRGAVLVGGIDVERIQSSLLRSHIAVVSQMPLQFFEGSVLENLCYGLDLSQCESYLELAQKICAKVEMHDFITGLDNGYDTLIKNGQFSGGQLQRLGIARALLANSEILILDEPTSALDEFNSRLIHRVLRESAQSGMSVIVVTHQTSLMELADQVVDICR